VYVVRYDTVYLTGLDMGWNKNTGRFIMLSVITNIYNKKTKGPTLTLRLIMSYIYGAPSKARNANVVYIWTYVWRR